MLESKYMALSSLPACCPRRITPTTWKAIYPSQLGQIPVPLSSIPGIGTPSTRIPPGSGGLWLWMSSTGCISKEGAAAPRAEQPSPCCLQSCRYRFLQLLSIVTEQLQVLNQIELHVNCSLSYPSS